MILAEGAILQDSALPETLNSLEKKITETLSGPPLDREEVISALAELGERLDSGEFTPLLSQYLSPDALEQLDNMRWMLQRETLEYKCALEMGELAGERPFGRAEVRPLGVLLHIAPGNMEGLPVFTAVEGLLAGNLNLVKLPGGDKGLSLALLKLLAETRPSLKDWIYAFDISSRDTGSLERLAALADGIVTWGGDGAISSMRRMAPPGCRLIEWGHRLSFAYLSEWEGQDRELRDLARHIAVTGGLLCSSCQVIFLDTDDMEKAKAFCAAFLPLLESAVASRSSAPGTAALYGLYSREVWLEHLTDRPDSGEQIFRGRGCTLTLTTDRELALSHLHANVLVKCLPREEILPVLRRQKGRLQTAGLICPQEQREALTELLSRAGVNRITRCGHMSDSFSGEAHDGEYPMRRYVRVVDIEKTE